MNKETAPKILCCIVMLGVFIAFAMIAFEREENRLILEQDSWIKQGYSIGE
jgi:hypothetical protein